MSVISPANKGMYTEELVNKTINHYKENNIALFQKAHTPTVCNKGEVVISGTADIDYYGVYQGRYISFEVKETRGEFFSMSQLKPHQIESLKNVSENGGISFIMINFIGDEDNVWIIDTQRIVELLSNNVRRIQVKLIKSYATHVPVEYPGIVDWIKHFIVG